MWRVAQDPAYRCIQPMRSTWNHDQQSMKQRSPGYQPRHIPNKSNHLLCNGFRPSDDFVFKSSMDWTGRPNAARLLISDMEFLRSLKSLCKASVFNSDDDDDDDSTCWRRCDELELFAIRDVVVLDFVVDDVELLLSTCVYDKLLNHLHVMTHRWTNFASM